MPEPIEAGPTTTATEPAAATAAPEVKAAKPETDWKAEARKWETRAKENSTAATKLAEIEEAKKTNEQKLEERATAAEKLAADKSLEAERALIALDKGLTASQAKRLVGTTREELTADADELLADLGSKSIGQVRSDPSQGSKATTGSQDPRQQFADALNSARGR
jgi:hypothetical protein